MTIVAHFEGRVIGNHFRPTLMEHHDDLAVIHRHTILGKRVEITSDCDKAWVHVIDSWGSLADIEHDLVSQIRVGQLAGSGNIGGDWGIRYREGLARLRKGGT